MKHEIDEDLLRLEKALGYQKFAYVEKRYCKTFTFYLIHIAGRIYFKEPKEKPTLLINCNQRKKDMASPKLMDFFRLVIRKQVPE